MQHARPPYGQDREPPHRCGEPDDVRALLEEIAHLRKLVVALSEIVVRHALDRK